MSKKISELPQYIGPVQPTGFLPISINDITYKIDPSGLVPVSQKYKVFTALLTQDSVSSLVDFGPGSLVVGTTYKIIQQSSPATGYDFTNVGAPNNNLGTTFIATGTTPNSWGNNNVGLRYDQGAPIAVILENNLGSLIFTYIATGRYQIISNGLFNDKTVSPMDQTINFNSGSNSPYTFSLFYIDNNTLEIEILNALGSFYAVNSMLTNKLIEIRVYN